MDLILYMRAGCGLCERLEELIRPGIESLRRRGLEPQLIRRDVHDNEHWRHLYDDRVPVLTLGGEVLLEGRPEPGDVRRAFSRLGAASPPGE